MAKNTRSTVPVTARALVQRINRKLAEHDLVVRKTRGGRAESELGDFYTLNFRINGIVETRVDLEALGREEAVLRDWEHLAE